MADLTSSILGSAQFIPEWWAQRSLDVLRANLVLTRTISTDTDWDAGWKGKTLHIAYPGTFSTVEKAEDTPLTPVTPSGGTGTSLVLNHLTVVPFALENYVQAIAQPGVLDKYITSATIGLAESIESTLYSDVVANFTGASVGTGGTPLDAAAVRKIKQELDNARAPQGDRYLVLSPRDVTALLGDTTLQTFWAFAAAQPGIRQGEVGELYGMQCMVSQLVPFNSGTNTYSSAGYYKDAGLMATRPLPPPMADSGVMQASAVDAGSGLSVTLQAQFDVNAMALRVNLSVLWGAIALRPTLGIPTLS